MNPISTANNYFVGTSANGSPNADNDRSRGSDVSNLLRDIANLLDGGNSSSGSSSNGASSNRAGQDGQLNDVAKFMQDLLALLKQGNDDQDQSSGVGGGGAPQGGPQVLTGLGGAQGGEQGGAPRPAATSAPASSAPPASDGASSSAPAASAAGASGASSKNGSTGLSTAPQTTANTPAQSKQVADAYMANLQKDFGLTKDQAAGVVANLWHESGGMNSGINQGGAIGKPSGNMADDNGNGYGIAQWGGSRKQGLLDFAASQKPPLDPSSQAANYGFLKQELQTSQHGAIDAVKNAKTPQAATQAFSDAFEHPSDPQMASRLANLSTILA